ncbi:MAG TPA: DNA polymerase III subunit gamma/tau [Blastocatellia bacterium]|nr:DNA polymerase III subunit gamma/tau [Blastocatellia bacterium]
MPESQVIARQFRPQSFTEVVGQEAITRTLSNAISSGRLHHAYLFTGARGVGKTTTARIFAKALNCIKGVTTEPCGVCASCTEIAASASMDVLEIDAASNTGVENVRDVIINTVSISPARDRYKIFIIDEVHMLSTSAFNALLKTLEEPPPHVVFIMATTELQKVPETILSRCQVFEFRTITLKKIGEQLRQIADQLGVKISDAALAAIARAGEGSMRDAESALDQVISFSGMTVADEDVSAALGLVDLETLNRTIRAIGEQDAATILRIVDEVVTRGYDLRTFCREMIVQLRALLVIKVAGFDAELVQVPASEGEAMVRLADMFSEQDIVRFFSILTKTEQDIRTSTQPRFHLEIGLMKLVHARRLYLLEEALNSLNDLQSRLGISGAAASGAVPPATPRPAGRSGGPTASGPLRAASREALATAKPAPPRPAPVAEMAPQASFKPAPVEAPPPLPAPPEDFYDGEPALPASNGRDIDDAQAVSQIIAALEARRKMMIVLALEKATVKIDGDFLVVAIAPENARDKTQLDGRDRRQLIEEVSREVMGRRLTLSVSVGGVPEVPTATPRPTATAKPAARQKASKEPAEVDPRVQAITEKFAGTVEIIKPE